MSPSVTIDHRFRGPATSGHGGYTCGVLARYLDTPATVMLKAPPPLDRPLSVVTMYYGGIELRDGEGDDAPVIGVADRRAPLADIINRSVNETLSRTILTTGTVVLVVLALYLLGGSVIHGFAFSLLIGFVVGTYSSVFIAAPIVLFFERASQSKQSTAPARGQRRTAAAARRG